ncbi:TRAP transporter substrate-binding protein DctP [Citricoccus nitrophenolicus]
MVGAVGIAGLALGLAACGSGQSADAEGPQTARLSSYLQENTSMGQAINAWADQTEECSDGQLEFERFHGGSLFGATDTRDAVANGRTEVGAFSAGYHTGEFPLTDGLFTVPFLSTNAAAIMDGLKATYEGNPDAQAEWNDQGMELLTMIPVTPVPFNTNVPFDSLDDLEGLNIRGYPAGGLNAAIKTAGGNPVDMEVSELPEAMQRGVVDGFTGVALDLSTALSLHESTQYYTEPGFGSTGAVSLAVNQAWWEDLPEDIRNCAAEAADGLVEPYTNLISEVEGASCETVREAGGEFSVLPEAEVEKWRSAIQEDQITLWTESVQGAVDDPHAYLEAYETAVHEAEAEHTGQIFGVEGCMTE